MNAKDIITRRFEKSTFNGYKTDDVDDFLREVSNEFAQLQKDKEELERKLEVLADKIREYRDDEDALKDALLIAQKQGNAIISESKAVAEKLKKETNETVTKQLADAKEKSEKMVRDAEDYSKRMTKDSNERADKLVRDARAKADEIRDAMNRQQEIQEKILQETRKEVLDYRTKLMALYKTHIEYIEQLPEKVENDYVKRVSEQVEKREAERAEREKAEREKQAKAAQRLAQKPVPKPVPKPAPKPDMQPVVKKEGSTEPFKAVEQQPAEKTAELPFFSNPTGQQKTKHTDLQFGKKK